MSEIDEHGDIVPSAKINVNAEVHNDKETQNADTVLDAISSEISENFRFIDEELKNDVSNGAKTIRYLLLCFLKYIPGNAIEFFSHSTTPLNNLVP